MSELRPCPRCKEALRLSVQTNHEFYGPDESLYFFVLCSACGHSSHSGYSREEAIKDWNTRPIEDAQSAEIERLNERVVELSNALLVEKADNARMREALEEMIQAREVMCSFCTKEDNWDTEMCQECAIPDLLNKAKKALKAVSNVQ